MLDNQYIKINLSNIGQNYQKLKSMLANKSVICSAVVKGNAYGLGLKEVVKKLHQEGCRDFWVSDLEEAYIAKQNAKSAHVYVFQGVNNKEELQFIIQNKLTPVISEIRQLELINGFLQNYSEYSLNIVLNFDTGMGRDGLQVEEIPALDLRCCNISYVMSHLSCAENEKHFLNMQQLAATQSLKQNFPQAKFTFANSGGIFLGKDYHFDMVRPGGALYGVNILKGRGNPMLNVVEFKASILNRKIFDKSQYIGYNATYKANKGDKVLVLNAGYCNGYRKELSNKSRVWVEGFYLPVIGAVSMNMITVNANQLPDNLFFAIKNVELIGEKISVEEIAKLSGSNTTQKEILTNLSNCKRIYI